MSVCLHFWHLDWCQRREEANRNYWSIALVKWQERVEAEQQKRQSISFADPQLLTWPLYFCNWLEVGLKFYFTLPHWGLDEGSANQQFQAFQTPSLRPTWSPSRWWLIWSCGFVLINQQLVRCSSSVPTNLLSGPQHVKFWVFKQYFDEELPLAVNITHY